MDTVFITNLKIYETMNFIQTITIFVIFVGSSLYACGTCFGDPNSSAVEGMNWAIISLLVTTGGVLSGIILSIRKLASRSKNYWENKGV
tara:strand:+ start:162 stop:428 length:267 start_codon:yes stop_codon:yes gene_type:complete